jgi:hypothetical protein
MQLPWNTIIQTVQVTPAYDSRQSMRSPLRLACHNLPDLLRGGAKLTKLRVAAV